MSTTAIVLFVAPFLVLVLVFGAVVVVALCQAKPEDVPNVWKECLAVFCRLVDRVPSLRRLPGVPQVGSRLVQHTVQDPTVEESA